MGDVKKTVEKAAKDVGKTVEKAVNDTGNYVSKDLGKDVVNLTNKGIDAYGGFVEHASGAKMLQWVDDQILNNNLDLYSGNLVTDYQNASKTYSQLGEGKAIEDNLKSSARVGAVAGAAIATGGATAPLIVAKMTPDAGNREWSDLFGGLAKAGGAITGFDAVGDVVNNIINPPKPPDEVFNGFNNNSDPYPTTIIEPSGINAQTVIPLIVVGVILLTVASVAIKKKRK